MSITRETSVLRVAAPLAPVWVQSCFANVQSERGARDGMQVTRTGADGLVLIEVRVPQVAARDAAQLQAAVQRTYEHIASLLCEHDRPLHPWRFWNYVPGILEPAGDLAHRYMAFNAGRQAALKTWHGASAFEPRIVAASAVDAGGDDLVVQLLAGPTPAQALENPRQRAAYRYSPRYGPVAPSFARASAAQHPATGEHLLISAGTASIVGETTRHAGCLGAQLNETLANLTALLAEGERAAGVVRGAAAWSQMRAYVVNEKDEAVVVAALTTAYPELDTLEVMPARLCRPDLLVEIEALAIWDSAADAAEGNRA